MQEEEGREDGWIPPHSGSAVSLQGMALMDCSSCLRRNWAL